MTACFVYAENQEGESETFSPFVKRGKSERGPYPVKQSFSFSSSFILSSRKGFLLCRAAVRLKRATPPAALLIFLNSVFLSDQHKLRGLGHIASSHLRKINPARQSFAIELNFINALRIELVSQHLNQSSGNIIDS